MSYKRMVWYKEKNERLGASDADEKSADRARAEAGRVPGEALAGEKRIDSL
jgi:hypothetical protein